MPKITVYLPDDLAEEVRAEDLKISETVQRCLRRELNDITAKKDALAAGYFARVEVYDEERERTVAFVGKCVGEILRTGDVVYLTQKGAIAIHDGRDQRLHVYDDPDDIEADDHELLQLAHEAVGRAYTEELDI
jgi:hypothetical protein